jgi:hypothetical protein
VSCRRRDSADSQAEIWKTYFSNPTERKVADIDANKDNLRHAMGSLHTSLFNIYNAIVRASSESREGTLDFFALVIRLNEKRAGMRVDPRTVSSDGFMTNLQVVLLKLFEPVMDITFSKVSSSKHRATLTPDRQSRSRVFQNEQARQHHRRNQDQSHEGGSRRLL